MAAERFGPIRIASVIGTRPEAIKMAPVLRALGTECGIEQHILLTGQHHGLTAAFDLPVSAIELGVDPREQSVGEQREAFRMAVRGYLRLAPPDLVLVQGDTTSALAGALAAKDLALPLGHVEAGLRTFDLQQPWPEEANRVEIDRIADLLFAPTEAAARNLAADEHVRGAIFVTGNTGIDALFHGRREKTPPARTGRKTILVTCHRKENQDEGIRRVAVALKRLVEELPIEILMPLHPNRHIRRTIEQLLSGNPHIALVEPLSHSDMIDAIDRCWLLLTDSGGLQEEGPALGKPVLVLRDVTERGEALESANIALVGTDPDRIVSAVADLLLDETRYDAMATPALPFGDGLAAPRIVGIIRDYLSNGDARNPDAAPGRAGKTVSPDAPSRRSCR